MTTIQSLKNLKNSEKIIRKLKKLNLSVDSLERLIKEPVEEVNLEQQQSSK